MIQSLASPHFCQRFHEKNYVARAQYKRFSTTVFFSPQKKKTQKNWRSYAEQDHLAPMNDSEWMVLIVDQAHFETLKRILFLGGKKKKRNKSYWGILAPIWLEIRMRICRCSFLEILMRIFSSIIRVLNMELWNLKSGFHIIIKDCCTIHLTSASSVFF